MTLSSHMRSSAAVKLSGRQLRSGLSRIAVAFGLAMAGVFGSAGSSVEAGETMRFPMTSDQAAYWRFVSDGVMGGVSKGRLSFESRDGVDFARLKGTVSTANNGGFIQFRAGLSLSGLPDGGAGLNGIRLVSRGNGETYYVHLRTRDNRRPWHYYAAAFAAEEDWQDVTLPFDSFRHSNGMSPPAPRPQDIISIGIVAYGREHNADVAVSEIAFY